MISIIVLTRNEEKNITRMLDSIESQNPHVGEVIVIDENSKDGTVEAIENYTGRLPLFYTTGLRKPIGFNRNLGAGVSKGDLLLFTEGNCFLKSGFLEKVEDVFKDDKVVAWASSSMPTNESVLISIVYLYYDALRWILSKLRLGFSVSGSILVVRRSVFNAVGGFGLEYNDDGVIGRKINDHCVRNGKRCIFTLDQKVAVVRSINRFTGNFWESVDHYFYIITNFVPQLQGLMRSKMFWDELRFREEERIT